MRYIGSKLKLLNEIEPFILSKVTPNINLSFLDLFSGTGSVAFCFKKHFKVITNDIMTYSYHLTNGEVCINTRPEFALIRQEMGNLDVLDYLNQLTNNTVGFIEREYSCLDEDLGTDNARCFFTKSNANKIDAIRLKIKDWKERKLINQSEESYLIACLIEAVTKISNTTGTYGAFLKFWESRAYKMLTLTHPTLFDNKLKNIVLLGQAEDVAKQVTADICYIDPPYNTRQYSSNYHLLETIARYDEPNLKGKAGIRIDNSERNSLFSSKAKAKQSFAQLLLDCQCKHIFVSYNSDGILLKDEIEELLLNIGIKNTYDFKMINYASYQSKIVKKRTVDEYLFYIQKANK
jgi:modification methylase stsI